MIRKKIIIICMSVALLLSFGLVASADYLGEFNTGNVYSFANSIAPTTIYSAGAWGSDTYGYFSLDMTPKYTLPHGEVTDKLTMQRYSLQDDEYVLKVFDITSHIRTVDVTTNAMIVAHSLGEGTLNSHNVSNLYYNVGNPIIIDLRNDYSSMPIFNIRVHEDYSNEAYYGLTPTVSFKYRGEDGNIRSYSSQIEWNEPNTDLLPYVYMSVPLMPSDIEERIGDIDTSYKALTVIDQPFRYVEIWDVTYSFDWNRDEGRAEGMLLETYGYYIANDINETYVNGDVQITPIQRYSFALAQKMFNEGIDYNGEYSFVESFVRGVDGFFSAEIFGDISIGDIFAVFICISVFIAFLKIFAGG